jgi:Cohesin domain
MTNLTVLLRPSVSLLALAVTFWCSGQNVVLGLASASGRPGDTVSLNISLNSSTNPSAIEFALNYSAPDFSAVSVNLGAAATAANKSVSCSQSTGSATCLIWGLNATVISNGVLATGVMTLSKSTAKTSTAVGLAGLSSASSAAGALTVSGTGNTINIQQIPVLNGFSCVPVSIKPTVNSACTLSLSSPAGVGGATVSISSSSAAAQVPAQVTIAQGSISTTVAVTAGTVSTATAATLTASYLGLNEMFGVTVTPASATLVDKVGIFRSGFFWILDVDGNRQFNSPPDLAFAFGGNSGDIPITGDWNGDGRTKVGVYRPRSGLFILDSNGDGMFDAGDAVYNLGQGTDPTDIPVVGDWNGDGRSKIGLFRQGFLWLLDYNGNGVFDQNIDKAYVFGGIKGDVPVVGDWTGSGTSKIGLVREGFYWLLDANGNGTFDGTGAGQDLAFPFGGIAGDVPVVGDWNGTGITKVGVFRLGFFWVLDVNGNYVFDGSGTGGDLAFAFGGVPGDKPVTGKW